MRATLYILILILVCSYSAEAQSKRKRKKANIETAKWNYEVECIGEGNSGVYTLKVYSILRDERLARLQAAKNAVHAVIFQGIQQNGRICSQKPPLSRSSNLELERKDFFTPFFAESSRYNKFVQIIQSVSDRMKISKKEFRIGTKLTVDVKGLRKELESAGVVKSLNNGF
jgi:hypothetical protein